MVCLDYPGNADIVDGWLPGAGVASNGLLGAGILVVCKSPSSKKNIKGFIKRSRNLSRKHDLWQVYDQKRSSFDYAAYHEASTNGLLLTAVTPQQRQRSRK